MGWEEKIYISFGKMPMCQISPCFFHNKNITCPPSIKGQTITTVTIHASHLILLSPVQAKLCISIVKMGKWSLWVASWYVRVTRGSEMHRAGNCSGIQSRHLRHPPPVFSPTATQVLSEKSPQLFYFHVISVYTCSWQYIISVMSAFHMLTSPETRFWKLSKPYL